MSRRLTVAMLSHLAKRDAPTGAERSLAHLATGLARRGHRVVVVTPGSWVLEHELIASGVEVATVPTTACWLAHWEHRPWPEVATRWLRFAVSSHASRRRLTAFLSTLRPDAIHVNCLPHLVGAAAASELGVGRAWHVREIVPPGPRRRFLAARVRSFAGKVVAVSHAVASWLDEEGLAGQVTVVHNGVETERSWPDRVVSRRALGLDESSLLVAYLGQLVGHKGVDVLLRAVAATLPRHPALHLALAGSGSPRAAAEIRRHATDLGCEGHFTLLPPQPEPWSLLAAADLVAVPSLTPDPLPRAVLEAMAAARPVVASATGGIGEMVEDGTTGLLVPAGNAAALARVLTTLADDGELRARLGEAGRLRAREQFSMKAHLDRMEALLTASGD